MLGIPISFMDEVKEKINYYTVTNLNVIKKVPMVPRYPHDTKCGVGGGKIFWGLESA
jgi:ssDNA-binding replication factor A large subunit